MTHEEATAKVLAEVLAEARSLTALIKAVDAKVGRVLAVLDRLESRESLDSDPEMEGEVTIH